MSDHIRRIIREQELIDRVLKPLNNVQSNLIEHADLYAKFSSRGAIIEAMRKEEEWRDKAMGMVDKSFIARTFKDMERYGGDGKQPWSNSTVSEIYDQQSNAGRLATEAASIKAVYDQSFRLPSTAELSSFTLAAISASSLAREVLGPNNALSSTLAAFQTPWAHIGEEIASASAMSEIIAMGRGIGIKGAFDEDFAEALRVNLGDWRDAALPSSDSMAHVVERMELYGAMGVNPELSDFPTEAFDESLRSAELLEDEIEEGDADRDGDAERARDAFERLRRFEVAVRRFIDQRMRAEFGEHWARQQLPAEMHDNWQRKRATAAQHESMDLPLIEYADFSDYKTIIERKDNWARVFKPIFGRSEDIRESFQRLFPVRIATMHARPIAQDDLLLLLVETKRVLRAIGGG